MDGIRSRIMDGELKTGDDIRSALKKSIKDILDTRGGDPSLQLGDSRCELGAVVLGTTKHGSVNRHDAVSSACAAFPCKFNGRSLPAERVCVHPRQALRDPDHWCEREREDDYGGQAVP